MNVKSNVKKYAVVAVIILLLVFSHYVKLLKPLEGVLGRALTPAAKSLYSLSLNLSGIFQEQSANKNLAEGLSLAKEEISRLTAQNAELKFLEEENSVLRKNLNFLRPAGGHYLMANVVSRGALAAESNDRQSVVIDKGAHDGLFPGLAVVSSTADGALTQGVIIGKVAKVKENISEIYLVTNKNCKIAAAILGENKTAGIAQGELGLTVRLDFIPQTENIKIGDLVATSGLEENIKRGLVVGRVAQVAKENNQVWQSAVIEPLLSLDNLTLVAILLP